MAIDIQSLFNPGSLQDMAETEDERKKRAQLTGTMNLGGQSGTFTGTFDPSLFQQTNTSAPVGYQPPPNYGMSAPPEQQTLPVVPAPAPAPPVGTNPISGEYTAPPQPPADLPTYNQPYQIPPPVTGFDDSMGQQYYQQYADKIFGKLTPGQALGGEFTMQQPTTESDQSMAQQYQQYADAVFGGSTPGQGYQPEFTMPPPPMTQDDRSRMLPPGPVAPEMIQPAPVQQPQPGTMPDYETMSQEDFNKQFGFNGFGSGDMWGNSYNALKNSDIGKQWDQGYKDWWDLKRSVMGQTTGRPDTSVGQTQGWDVYNQQEKDYFNRVDQGMQQDSRYTSLSPYGKTNMFQTYLGQQGKTLDPTGSNQDLQNFLAADTYFKRFIEPNLLIGFNSGSGPVPVAP